ncbi:hypothetical protein DY000_02058792 [Brassica cretica]|uniref:Uncharacterized protein n=1 Tax=Brassica cretica TaxID=69181 RepID=A0ABQ7AP89_BRACR|nr:hypothetical protein DY000_02058792 [Brassica cretica]
MFLICSPSVNPIYMILIFDEPNLSSNQRPSVCHSTFDSLRLGRSSQSIASGFLRLWDSLNFKKDMEFVGITVLFLDEKVNSVIYGFTPVGRANHYMTSLKTSSIGKVDRFEVGAPETNLQSIRLFDNLQVIASTNLELPDSVIYGFTPVGRANHYMSSLKAGSIGKVDRFEVGAPETNLQSIRLFDNLQVIASTNLELPDAYEEDEDDNQDQ